MDNLPIVDAHHHLWDLENEKTKYSWLMVKEGEAFLVIMELLEKAIN